MVGLGQLFFLTPPPRSSIMASARSSEFSFFWKSGSPFSQWHPSRFVGVCPYEAKDAAPQTFFTAEV